MKRGLAVLLILLIALFCLPNNGHTAAGEACPLFVEPILPPDNVGSGSFHIQADPGETVAFKAVLHNLTGHTLTLHFIALNAYSGLDGIFYEAAGQADAEAFLLADGHSGLAQYMSMADTIPLVAGMSAVLTVTVMIPDTQTGTLMGGFRVEVEDETRSGVPQTIDTPIRIDMPSVAAVSVAAGDVGIGEQEIRIPVVNRASAIAKNVLASYELRDEQGDLVLQGEAVLPEMAPLTGYTIACPAESMVWADGDYALSVRISADGQAEDFLRIFTADGAYPPESESHQEMLPLETDAVRPEVDAAIVANQKDRLQAAVVVQPVEQLAATGGSLNRSFARAAVCSIAAAFICVLVWMRDRTRRRGKHERSPRWAAAKGRHAA